MKKRKIIYIITILVAIVSLVSVTYAWYVYIKTLGSMQFSILQIESQVALYHASDTNFNGVPDMSPELNKYYNQITEKYTSYGNQYYDEKYKFTYLDQRYSLIADSESNLLNTVEINDIAPSKIYTYKFEIINYAACENTVEFSFDQNNLDSSKLDQFEVRLGLVNLDTTVTYSNWKSLSQNQVDLVPMENVTVPAFSDNVLGQRLEVGRLDLWLQVRVKSEVTEHIANAFTLPMYRLTLGIPED